jgi:hypothetical protein
MQRRVFVAAALSALPVRSAFAHHGWSSFDQGRPIYLQGRVAKVAWRNPHAEIDLEVAPDLQVPPDLKARTLPAQSASVDGPKLLAAATVPDRKDRVWHVELAPLTRMQAWRVDEPKPGTPVEVVGFTFGGEKGDAVLRAEYLFVHGKAYGLRSAPM